MERLLLKGRLPEDIRLLLLEALAEQNEQEGMKLSMVRWPGGDLQNSLLWNRELLYLKKYPELFEQLMTEDFLCEYLWVVAGGFDSYPAADKKKLIKELKPLAGGLQDPEAMWNVVKKHKSPEMDLFFCSGWYDVRSYLRIWKTVTGKKISLSVVGDPYWEKCMEENADVCGTHSYSDYIDAMVELVDRIEDADSLKKKVLFEYFFREGKEAGVLAALKKNLLTAAMIPAAIKYVEEKNQLWAFPLLMLKCHGEFEVAKHEV